MRIATFLELNILNNNFFNEIKITQLQVRCNLLKLDRPKEPAYCDHSLCYQVINIYNFPEMEW